MTMLEAIRARVKRNGAMAYRDERDRVWLLALVDALTARVRQENCDTDRAFCCQAFPASPLCARCRTLALLDEAEST